MTKPKLIYVAHRYGGDDNNLEDAARIVLKLNQFANSLVLEKAGDTKVPLRFWAPWLMVCECHDESFRSQGLNFDIEALKVSHGLLLVGDMSNGMRVELTASEGIKLPVHHAETSSNDDLRVAVGFFLEGMK